MFLLIKVIPPDMFMWMKLHGETNSGYDALETIKKSRFNLGRNDSTFSLRAEGLRITGIRPKASTDRIDTARTAELGIRIPILLRFCEKFAIFCLIYCMKAKIPAPVKLTDSSLNKILSE